MHAAAITFAELTWDLSWTTRDGTDRTPVIPSIWSAKIPAAAMSSADVPEPGRSRTDAVLRELAGRGQAVVQNHARADRLVPSDRTTLAAQITVLVWH